MTVTTDTPRIYVACLASYNNGILHGAWIDVDDVDTVNEQIQEMLALSPMPDAEEWAIHDFEGFKGYQVEENPDLDTLCTVAQALNEHGDAMAAFLSNNSTYNTPDMFQDVFLGEYKDQATFAEEWAEMNGSVDLDAEYSNYIDFDAWGHSLLMDGFYDIDGDGCIYVFYRN